MTYERLSLVAVVGVVTLLVAPARGFAQVSPTLGNATTFSILAGSSVTNTGATTINGDVGVSPGIGPTPHFTGFGTVVFGPGAAVHDADAGAASAVFDSAVAYGALDQGCTVTFAGAFKELAGAVLPPGVYCATSFHLTTGTLTLTGTAANSWIFKSSSDLVITGGGASRVLSPSCNVWWRVVSNATFDAGSSLIGNILASTSISLAAGASLSGRAFASTAGVTLSSNAITSCSASGASPTAPTVTKAFSSTNIFAGGASTLTITLGNPNATATALTAPLTDILPGGMVVAAAPSPSTTCGAGVVTAAAGGSTITLAAGSVIPSGSCTITLNVSVATLGTFTNSIGAGSLVTPIGSNPGPAIAALTTTAAAAFCRATAPELSIAKSHTGPFVSGTNATYSIALTNNGLVNSSGAITVTDTLPAGLTFVSASGSDNWTCTAVAQVVTCAADLVAAPGAYPHAITLTVTPGDAAVPSVTNNATVAGGGDCDLTNNSSADVTVVGPSTSPTPVPTLSEWAFILLAALLAGAGIAALRSRA